MSFVRSLRRFSLIVFALVGISASLMFYENRALLESYEAENSAALAPNLSATKSAALQTDANGNGVVNPGDTLRYTVQVQNTGADAATNLTINDTIDQNTTHFQK
jgi:uncharacterized repeat protein (TIGR01451 family)